MGVVHEVFDRERNIRLALKGLHRMSPQRLLRFKDEFRTLRDIHHPNLVSLGELIEEDGQWFFTMEVVDGTSFVRYVRNQQREASATLASTPSSDEADAGTTQTKTKSPQTAATRASADRGRREQAVTTRTAVSVPAGTPRLPPVAGREPARALAHAPPLDEQRLRSALVQLVRGLEALHRAGKVHRDIKPSNILVSDEGRLVLLDFGVAVETSAAATDAERVVGTAAYMAPEQAAGHGCGPAADWYAVGTLVYEVLAGRPPYGTGGEDVLARKRVLDPPALEDVAPWAPDDLARLCDRLLARDPARRPGADEILAVLGVEDRDEWIAAGGLHARSEPDFVGRARELKALAAAFDEVREGGAAVVSLEGPSGIGKSAIARQFVDDVSAGEDRVIVLRGRCHEQESVPYRAFDGVVDDLGKFLARLRTARLRKIVPEGAGHLVTLFPTLETVDHLAWLAGQESAGGESPREVRHRGFAALRGILAAIGRRRQLVVHLEDVQWADEDSVALLRTLVEPPMPPLFLLMTARQPEGEACAAVRAAGDHVRRLPIGGLAGDEVRALVRSLTGRDPGDRIARLVEDTGGHPMFLEEMVSHEPAERERVVSLDDALRARVERLEPPARQLLEVVAAAGTVSQEVCANAARMSSEQYAEQVASLRAGRLVRISGQRRRDPIEPYHDRIRASVYEAVPTGRRRQVHAALAGELERAGAAPDVLGLHHERAGDAAAARACYERAARGAREALAFDHAANQYRAALRLVRDDAGEQRRLSTELGAALVDAGRPAQAAEVFLAASELPGTSEDDVFELRRRAAEQYMQGGHTRIGLDVVKEVLAEVGLPYSKSHAGALASALWADVRLRLSSLEWKSHPPDEVPVQLRRKLDVLWSIGSGMSYVDSIGAWRYTAVAPFIAMKAGDDFRIARAMAVASYNQALLVRKEATRRLIDAAHRAAERDGSPVARFYAEAADIGYLFWIDNDYRRTLELAEACARLWHEAGRGAGFEADTLETFICWSLQNLGRMREAQERVTRLVERARRAGNRLLEVSFRAYLSSLALLDDDPDRVDAEADAAVVDWFVKDDYTLQDYWRGVARTKAALYRGSVEAASAELEDTWRAFDRSSLGRIQILRMESSMMRASLYLARAAEAPDPGHRQAMQRRARKRLGVLRRVRQPSAKLQSRLVEAALAHQEGREEDCVSHLEDVCERARTRSGSIHAAASVRLASIVGGTRGEELRAEAQHWFEHERLRAPERMVAMVSPGWPHPG